MMRRSIITSRAVLPYTLAAGATVRRQTVAELARQVPLDHNRIALLADQHLRSACPPLWRACLRSRCVVIAAGSIRASLHAESWATSMQAD